MNYGSFVWAVVALAAIVAAWDTFYRFFQHRRSTSLEERLGAVEDEVARLAPKAEEAAEYARTIASRVATGEANRWSRVR
jgi:hypothetical protein